MGIEKIGKNFIIADFSPSPGPVSEYGMTPCQARGRLFFHRACPWPSPGQALVKTGDRLSFPHRACPSRRQGRESTKKASISRWIPAGAEPVPGLRQGRLSRRRGNSLSPASARACPRDDGGQALAKARDGVVKLFNRQLWNFVTFSSENSLTF